MTALPKRFWDKTHCLNGHEFTPENTHFYTKAPGTVQRICRACRRIRAAALRSDPAWKADPVRRAKQNAAARAKRAEVQADPVRRAKQNAYQRAYYAKVRAYYDARKL